jgi:uncharacterized membrane protein YdfJ with MMPL/SSD domain
MRCGEGIEEPPKGAGDEKQCEFDGLWIGKHHGKRGDRFWEAVSHWLTFQAVLTFIILILGLIMGLVVFCLIMWGTIPHK